MRGIAANIGSVGAGQLVRVLVVSVVPTGFDAASYSTVQIPRPGDRAFVVIAMSACRSAAPLGLWRESGRFDLGAHAPSYQPSPRWGVRVSRFQRSSSGVGSLQVERH